MIPVGSPRSSLVEKFPSVQITAGSISSTWLEQVLPAVLDLDGLRVAIAGGPALQHVRDEHIRAAQSDLHEQRLEEFPGPADERQALLILAGARGLAYEHQLSVRVARAEHDGFAGRRKLGAALADPCARENLLQRLAALGGHFPARRRRHRRDGSSSPPAGGSRAGSPPPARSAMILP